MNNLTKYTLFIEEVSLGGTDCGSRCDIYLAKQEDFLGESKTSIRLMSSTYERGEEAYKIMQALAGQLAKTWYRAQPNFPGKNIRYSGFEWFEVGG